MSVEIAKYLLGPQEEASYIHSSHNNSLTFNTVPIHMLLMTFNNWFMNRMIHIPVHRQKGSQISW